jgi:hypothetical protein
MGPEKWLRQNDGISGPEIPARRLGTARAAAQKAGFDRERQSS